MDMKSLLLAEVNNYPIRKWQGTIGGQDIELFSNPLTPADVEFVRRKYPEFTTQPEPSAMVNIICRKAYKDESLTMKAFNINIEGKIMKEKVKNDLIGDIFSSLFGDDFEDDTDLSGAVKNSEKGQRD